MHNTIRTTREKEYKFIYRNQWWWIFVTFISDQVGSNKEELPNWRQRSVVGRFVINDLQQSGSSVDKVNKFYLRPPELRSTI